MTQAQLARKLARLSGDPRPPMSIGAVRANRPADFDPRAFLADEQDRRRECLAEELLKIFAEEITWKSAENDEAEQANATRAATCAAKAALAAATVLYPEIPEPVNEGRIPNAAVEGAQSVAPDYRGMEAMQTAVYEHADPEGRRA